MLIVCRPISSQRRSEERKLSRRTPIKVEFRSSERRRFLYSTGL